ncbi:MAG: succinate dehydrogenase, partial [Bacteroidales bacterium]|nr:succinate dehydrogenase [Bacteroidales bacterium]
NMLVLGIVILGFICYHLTHFWAKMQLPEMFGIGVFENNPYLLLNATFGKWWLLVMYIIWFAALFLHLTHGFWSMFQTVGWDGKTWFKRIKVIGVIVAGIICLMFTATAINAFLQANGIIGA